MDYLFEKLTQNIKSHSNVVLMTHKRPDLDGMTCCVALAKICEGMKKDAYIVYPNEKVNLSLEKGVNAIKEKGIKINYLIPKEIESIINDNTLLIILDTHKPELVEDSSIIDKINDVFVIDHHMNSCSHIEKAIFEYINSNKSSTVEIIVSYLKYLKKSLDPVILSTMQAGMEIDTNGYNLKTTEDTFKIAAYLTKNGADPILKQEILKESKEEFVKRHNYIKDSYYIKEKYLLCEIPDEIEANINLAIVADEMLKFEGIDATFAVGKLGDNVVGVSARSTGKVNVEVIMNIIGGGGHINAAAAQITNKSIEEVVEMIKQAIEEE